MPCTRGLVSPAGVHIGMALASTWQLAQRGCVTTASILFQASSPLARLTLPGGSASLAASSLATTIPVRATIDEAANASAIRTFFMARPHTKSMNLLKGISRMRFPVAAKIALASAGAAGGTGGSPTPLHLGIVLQSANLDDRTLVDPHRFVVVVVGLLHRALCVGEFAVDGVAEPPDDAALHLVFEVDGIDDLADIGRDPDLVDPDASVRHGHFDDFGRRRPKGLDERHAASLALTQAAPSSPTSLQAFPAACGRLGPRTSRCAPSMGSRPAAWISSSMKLSVKKPAVEAPTDRHVVHGDSPCAS